MILGSGLAPVAELRAAGAPVGLGVDGSSSADSASLWLEARTAMLQGKLRHGAGSMSARDALEVATRGGAACLGRTGEIGELSVGACGDLVVWPLDGVRFAGALSDPVEAWLRCGPVSARHTVVGGRLVVEDGVPVHPGLDEQLAVHRRVSAAHAGRPCTARSSAADACSAEPSEGGGEGLEVVERGVEVRGDAQHRAGHLAGRPLAGRSRWRRCRARSAAGCACRRRRRRPAGAASWWRSARRPARRPASRRRRPAARGWPGRCAASRSAHPVRARRRGARRPPRPGRPGRRRAPRPDSKARIGGTPSGSGSTGVSCAASAGRTHSTPTPRGPASHLREVP